ncbi:MAG TPA: hypothetical protein VG917_05290 [Patescibacteria group bacterium]|nr:hypothetical protein [Patescibacteria group bacterium]
MFPEIKIIASFLASIIAIIAYIPYLIDMFKGKNKPHLYTWISIVMVTTIVAYIQLIGGAGIGAIPTIVGDLIDIVILFYCFRYGTKDIVEIDKVCLVISIIGVVVYVLFRTLPVFSLAIVTTAEIVSFIPTFRKTRNDPYSESLTSYYIVLIKLMLIIIALQSYNLLTVSYSATWITIYVIFLLSVFYWRSNKKHHNGTSKNTFPQTT